MADCLPYTTDANPLEQTALLLVGHGTRDPSGVAEFMGLARLVQDRSFGTPVFASFLELARPTIAEAVASAIAEGARQIAVIPVLLFAAGHAKDDIPEAVAAAIRSASHGDREPLTWRQAAVLDALPVIAELSAARFREAIMGRPEVPTGETCLVLVGRGSHDAEGTAAMHRFAAQCAAEVPVAQVEVGFVAMAEPPYADVLRRVADRPWQRVVVQPHLLFRGQLLGQIERGVERIAGEFPRTEWIVTRHIGPDERLAAAIMGVFRGL